MRSVLTAALALLLAVPAARADFQVPARGAVQVVSDMALGPRQRNGFEKFRARGADFHGAYYVSTGSDDGSFWVDEHRLEDAKASARANCRAYAANKRAPCVLYAVIVPRAVAGQGRKLPNVNATLSRELQQSATRGRKGTWFAVAADRSGSWGISWGKATREAARQDALVTCNRRLAGKRFREQMPPAVFNEALRGGRFDCKLVAEVQRR